MEGKCPCCGSKRVEHMTRVTGFFSKVEGWNKGKVAELMDRRAAIHKNMSSMGESK
jgi:anaerobic ribonucleoside-triphosphate reductase